ncbi:MAG: hypothetical protein IIB56_09885 [Planctomycetes bacterium]|nr:hypothetical protein [Planctomycetota bacterium]
MTARMTEWAKAHPCLRMDCLCSIGYTCNFGADLHGCFFYKIVNKFGYIFCSVTQESLNNLVELYEAWGKPEKAAEWRAKLPPNQTTQGQWPPLKNSRK